MLLIGFDIELKLIKNSKIKALSNPLSWLLELAAKITFVFNVAD